MESWKIQLSPSEVAPGRRTGARCLRLRPRLALLRYMVLSRTSVSCKAQGTAQCPAKGSFRVPSLSTHSSIPLFSMDLPSWLPSSNIGWPCICSLCLHSPDHWASSGLQEEVRSSILPTHLEKCEILTREVQKSLGLQGTRREPLFLPAHWSLPICVIRRSLFALCFLGLTSSLWWQWGRSQLTQVLLLRGVCSQQWDS